VRYTKYISILFIGIIILSSTVTCITAQSDDLKLWDKLLLIRWKLGRIVFGGPFFVLRFVVPETFTAEPSIISLKYLNQTDIIIGSKDPKTGEFRSLDSYGINSVFVSHDFECSLEIPDYVPEDAFVPHFNPQFLVAGVEGDVKTKLRINSYIPKNATLPKNIQLRVNITKFTTFGNIFFPPKEEDPNIFYKISWFLSASGIFPGNPFGWKYSGKRLLEYTSFVDIIVKVDRFHLVDIIPQNGLEIGPDQLVNISLEVRNRGSHTDSFNFRVNTDSYLVVSPPPAITLEPNEVVYTSIGVASPRILNDPGSARSINIEAYSIYEPNTIFNNTATIITRGIYVSEVVAYYFVLLLFAAMLFYAFISFRKRRIFRKICKKPDKPWTIPEEKEYLVELKKKDRKEFEKVRLMMEDEYKSSMLWYKNYCIAIKRKERRGKLSQIISVLKRPKKKEIKPPKKERKLAILKKVEKPIEKPEIQKIQEEFEEEREKVLQKIKREQEKQIKKLKKRSSFSK